MTSDQDSLFTLQNVLSVLPTAERQGAEYVDYCVVHDDGNPSMAIKQGRNGQAVVCCRSQGCDVFSVLLQKVRESVGRADFVPSKVPSLPPSEPEVLDPATASKILSAAQQRLREEFLEPFSEDAVVHFLESRGVSCSIAEKLGFGSKAGHTFKSRDRESKKWIFEDRPALVMPSVWNGSVLGVKYRSIAPSSKSLKWAYEVGSRQDVLQYADLPRVKNSRVVGVFEAALDAALVRSLGFNAVTIPSASFSQSERFEEGITRLKEDYDHILLIGDADEAGQVAMRRLQEMIGKGSAFAKLPSGFKDVGEFFQSDKSATKLWLDSTYSSALGCAPVPRGLPRERLIEVLTNGLEQAKQVAEPSAAAGIIQNNLAALFHEMAPTYPADLTETSLHGLVGKFVEATLPFTEADQHSLTYQFLAAVGNLLGAGNYASFSADRHYPAIFQLIVGSTSSGKGQALGAVRSVMGAADESWPDRVKYSAASGEALVRMVSQQEDDKRVFAVLPEMSVLLNSMNRDGSNLSGYLRQGWDRLPMEVNRSRESFRASDYLLSVVGHITADELAATMNNVDLYNGVANRFLWAIVKRSKTLARSPKSPDVSTIGAQLKKLQALPAQGQVDFSDEGARVWDAWVHSLVEPTDGKLAAAVERTRPNALRVALIYALLDEKRLSNAGPCYMEAQHVRAAIEVVTRSRQSVQWFLTQPGKVDAKAALDDIMKVKTAVNQADGRLSGTALSKLFSHKTAEQRVDIATRAGLKLRKQFVSDKGGKPADVWTF
jgi:Protein of unknown function (DUF3987)/Toprim-like